MMTIPQLYANTLFKELSPGRGIILVWDRSYREIFYSKGNVTTASVECYIDLVNNELLSMVSVQE